MNTVYRYVLKKGITMFGESCIFDRQLTKNNLFVDLRSGEVYQVMSITNGKDHKPEMPHEVVQSWPLKTLTEDELIALHTECKFADSEDWYRILPEKGC